MKKYPYLTYFVVPVSGLSTDIYVPAMPEMMQAFHCSAAHIQYSITFFVLATGLAQLMAGPICDAINRKKPMIIASIGQLLAIALLLTFQNANVLWLARFIQGFSVGFLVVPGRAILSDCYQGHELDKRYNTMTACYSLAPIVSPFIGGFAQSYFGWQMCFIVPMVYVALLLLYLIFVYQETHPNPGRFYWANMYHNYAQLLPHGNFLLLAFSGCLYIFYTSIFVTLGPFMLEKTLGLSPIGYGYLGLLIGVCWFMGNFCCRMVFHWPRPQRIIITLLLQTMAIALCGFLPAAMGWFSVSSVMCLFMPAVFTAGFIFPLFVGEGLSLFPQLAATANASYFSMLWLWFSLASYIASLIPHQGMLWLAVSFLVINLLSLVSYLLRRQFQ